MNTMVPRDVRRWGKPVRYYETLSAFVDSHIFSDGITTIKHQQTFIDLLFRDLGTDTLIVSFHPALDTRQGKKVPIFIGQSVSGSTYSALFVSDPAMSVDPKLTLGWFHGTSKLCFDEVFPQILRLICERKNIKKLIFFGVSGGGYAAARFSSMFPGSVAISVNPQTLIWNFNPMAVTAYLKGSFGFAGSPPEIEEFVKATIGGDLRVNYSAPSTNCLIYVQNGRDHHVEKHAVPFLNALDASARRRVTYIACDEWGDGHVAPPLAYMQDLIAYACEYHADIISGNPLPDHLLHPEMCENYVIGR